MVKKLSNSNKIAIVIFAIIFSFTWIINLKGPALPTGDSGSMLISSQALYSEGNYSWPTYEISNEGSVSIVHSTPNTVWPPSCAAVIMTLRKAGFSEITAVRIFVSFFAGLTFSLVYLLAFRITNRLLVSLAISMTMASMWNSYYWIIHSFMPEGIYISFTVLSTLLAINVLEKVRSKNVKPHHFILLGFVTGLTYYIKSAAPAFILSLVMSFLILSRSANYKMAWSQIMLLLTSIAMTSLPWFLRNLSIGTIGGAGVASPTPIRDSLFALLRLFVPKHGSYFENKITLVFALIFVLIVALIFFLSFKRLIITFLNISTYKKVISKIVTTPTYLLSILYCCTFVIVILFAIYVVPKASHIETRYWMEVFPFAIPVILSVVLSQSNKRLQNYSRSVKYLLYAVVSLIFISNLLEITRNQRQVWTILKSEEHQKRFRKTLIEKLETSKNVRYTTNYGNQLFADSGLSYWDVRDTLDSSNKNLNIYLEYTVEQTKTMSLGTIQANIPIEYEFRFKLDDYNVYSPLP